MIKVLFFASLRERLRCDELTLAANGIARVDDVLAHLLHEHPQWQESLMQPAPLAAVNGTLAPRDAAVRDGDEVAFFPPVTGG